MELLIDPTNRLYWKYRVFAEGDSCEIYSPYIEEANWPEMATITLGPPREN